MDYSQHQDAIKASASALQQGARLGIASTERWSRPGKIGDHGQNGQSIGDRASPVHFCGGNICLPRDHLRPCLGGEPAILSRIGTDIENAIRPSASENALDKFALVSPVFGCV